MRGILDEISLDEIRENLAPGAADSAHQQHQPGAQHGLQSGAHDALAPATQNLIAYYKRCMADFEHERQLFADTIQKLRSDQRDAIEERLQRRRQDLQIGELHAAISDLQIQLQQERNGLLQKIFEGDKLKFSLIREKEKSLAYQRQASSAASVPGGNHPYKRPGAHARHHARTGAASAAASAEYFDRERYELDMRDKDKEIEYLRVHIKMQSQQYKELKNKHEESMQEHENTRNYLKKVIRFSNEKYLNESQELAKKMATLNDTLADALHAHLATKRDAFSKEKNLNQELFRLNQVTTFLKTMLQKYKQAADRDSKQQQQQQQQQQQSRKRSNGGILSFFSSAAAPPVLSTDADDREELVKRLRSQLAEKDREVSYRAAQHTAYKAKMATKLTRLDENVKILRSLLAKSDKFHKVEREHYGSVLTDLKSKIRTQQRSINRIAYDLKDAYTRPLDAHGNASAENTDHHAVSGPSEQPANTNTTGGPAALSAADQLSVHNALTSIEGLLQEEIFAINNELITQTRHRL